MEPLLISEDLPRSLESCSSETSFLELKQTEDEKRPYPRSFRPAERILCFMDSDSWDGADSLLFRLLKGASHSSDRETITEWEIDDFLLNFFSGVAQNLDKQIEVLRGTQAFAPEIWENLETEIISREAKKRKLELDLFKGLVCKQSMEIEGLGKEVQESRLKVEETEKENGVLRRELTDGAEKLVQKSKVVEDQKIRVKTLDMRILELESTQLREKADMAYLEGAHKTECQALRSKAERLQEIISSLSTTIWKSLSEAVNDGDTGQRQLDKNVSETLLGLEAVSKSTLNLDGILVKVERGTIPDNKGDIVQTYTATEERSTGSKRSRDDGQDVETNVPMEPPNDGSATLRGKRAMITNVSNQY